MAHITFDRPTRPRSGARVLEKHVAQYFNDGIGDVGVIVRAAHVSAFTRKVIAIANFVLLCPNMVFIICFRSRLRVVWIDAVAIFVHWNEFLGFDARNRERVFQKLRTATKGSRGGPKSWRSLCR